MRRLNLPRPSASMAVAMTALMVALGGGAYAQSQLAKNSVGTPQIKNNAVTGTKIAPNAIVSSRIKDGQVRSADIRDNSVQRADIAPLERTVWVAVKGSDGSTLRQSGEVVKTTRIAPGRYTITFNKKVDMCGWVASTSSDATTNLGYAEAHRSGSSATELEVVTSKPVSGQSVLVDSDFHLVVVCGTQVAPT